MNYDLRITPEQLDKLAGWAFHGESAADVELAADDRMLVAQQGDELMAWDTGGEPASEIYLDANPPLDPTGSDRHARAFELLRMCSQLELAHVEHYDDIRRLGAEIDTYLETGR